MIKEGEDIFKNISNAYDKFQGGCVCLCINFSANIVKIESSQMLEVFAIVISLDVIGDVTDDSLPIIMHAHCN